ncbi:MAG: EAL domain-containing protein [Brevundimonas sp.]|uniref:EAL domain-containing protein n=1 Tax=Brevundimonas sp. TaxID=1871086 RepID=UPI00391981B5
MIPRFPDSPVGPRLRNAIWSTLLLAAVAAALFTDALRPVEDVFKGVRFTLAPSDASQTLTIVEIDSRSLHAADSWPWDRTRYAEAIEHLIGAGAILVAMDVDFSAASDPVGDQSLADAISRHPGQVALANFVQAESYGPAGQALVENTPLAMIRRDAMLASVNVPVDSDGQVRSYDASPGASNQPSLAALLAGGASTAGMFDIDYGIDHRSIPHLSFDDVLHDRFDRSLVAGRMILVGATALELGDEFATPAGLVPGVYLHGLAYESLVGGRALGTLHPLALLGLCGALVLLLMPTREGGAPLRWLVYRHLAVAAVLFLLPIALQILFPISLQIAPLVLTQILLAVWATRVELDRRERAIAAEREAGLLHLATHQPETGLPNLRLLLKDISQAWEACPQACLSVITVGVERHADMRGVVGYGVANALIVQLAQRMSGLVQARCAHISTSVLAFAREDLDESSLAVLLSRLQELETNFEVDGNSIDIFIRVGAARQADGPISPELLVERSTAALNLARASDDHAVVYDEATFGSPANNLALMTEMRGAMGSGGLSLHYQPKMTTADGGVASVEALCRWRHPVRGFLAPDLFIPIAEETGHIRGLTEWSLDRAIADQIRLRGWGHDVTIAINVSGRLLQDDGFKATVLATVAGTDAKLCFEITETAVIQNPAKAIDSIAAYRAAGIKISIDDYGSGLSSLGYLKMLNADELKIDRSLVLDLLKSQRDRLIMKSTIDLAHGLGMSVVAEGVETQELTACLALLGCDVIQGYWFSKPLPILQLAEFMDSTTSIENQPSQWARQTTALPAEAIIEKFVDQSARG